MKKTDNVVFWSRHRPGFEMGSSHVDDSGQITLAL